MKAPLEDICRAFEEATGLNLALYDLRGRLKELNVPRSRMFHRSSFCNTVKKTREKQCIQCDQKRALVDSLKHQAPFIRACHANADELIIPVLQRGELLIVGFLGQFTVEYDAACPDTQLPVLPRLSRTEAENLVYLAEIFRGFLADLLTDNISNRRPLDKRIHSFISDHLSSDPCLDDLAAELNLSPSRTRHLVKETCGKPYTQVKNEIRVSTIKDMLRHTNASLHFIARQAGIRDVDYFYRYFRKHTGMTAREFRNADPRSNTSVTA